MHSSIRLENHPIEILKLTPLNPLVSKCEIKVCYVSDQPNRNRSVITKEVARKMANSLPGSPIVGFYNEDKEDFGEHDKELVVKNGKVMLKEKTRPYGFVDLNAKVWFAKYLDDNSVEREYLVTEGFLWTGQYEEARRILEKGNNHSMELDEDHLDAFWTKAINDEKRLFILNDAIISKLCILGQDEEPCFEGSRITAPTLQFSFDDGFKEQLFSMMKELKDLLQEGGTKMFTRYDVSIGDSLWNALYNHVEANYAAHAIESVCEVEGQKFAILASDDKYYRLNFCCENEETTFGEEITEIDNYIPAEEPQFKPEEVENYKNLGKTEKEQNNKNEGKTEEVEKCPKCNKPIEECTCNKKPEYNLEEVAEYVELQSRYAALESAHTTLQTSFSALETNFNVLKLENENLLKEIEPLAQFKKDCDKKEKKAMIDRFYMLSEDDKKDVLENIDNYSLDDIEARLSVICVRKKVSFSVEPEQNPVSYSFNTSGDSSDDESTPAWVKAALRVAKTLNN